MRLDIAGLREMYTAGEVKPSDVVTRIYDRIDARPLGPTWISLVPREMALARARAMESDPTAFRKPLYGIPFAIKDNIDLAGLFTTAGCPAYAYLPTRSASVVQSLMDAGAIPIGKTNLDQFATGLGGTRSPYGACPNVFDEQYISGGSSSGSAVAVAQQLVSLALGTDTAGSGRVPAAFINIVGLKPTRGLLSTAGCPCLPDHRLCIDLHGELRRCPGRLSCGTRVRPIGRIFARRASRPGGRALVGGHISVRRSRCGSIRILWQRRGRRALSRSDDKLEQLGGQKVEIDFSSFRAAAQLLFSGPWLAERLASISSFVESRADQMDPVVHRVISGGSGYSAVDAFQAVYRLEELRRAAALHT